MIRLGKNVDRVLVVIYHRIQFMKHFQQLELLLSLIAVLEEGVLSLLAQTLLAVGAQQVRSNLICRLECLIRLNYERVRIFAFAPDTFVRRFRDEMAVLKFCLVAAKATKANCCHYLTLSDEGIVEKESLKVK